MFSNASLLGCFYAVFRDKLLNMVKRLWSDEGFVPSVTVTVPDVQRVIQCTPGDVRAIILTFLTFLSAVLS